MAGLPPPPPFRPGFSRSHRGHRHHHHHIQPIGIVTSFRRFSYRYIPPTTILSYNVSPEVSMILLILIVLLIIGGIITGIYCGVTGKCSSGSHRSSQPPPGPYPYSDLSILQPKLIQKTPETTETTQTTDVPVLISGIQP